MLSTTPPFVMSMPQPAERALTVTTPSLSVTVFCHPTKARLEGAWLVPSMDIAKAWLPLGALTVTTPALSEALNPTKERVAGVDAVPSRDTLKGERSQLMVFDPSIEMLEPA